MERCIEVGDCGYDAWDHTWAVEGGADLLAQHMMRIQAGLSMSGNYPLDNTLNALGPLVYYGEIDGPHYAFSFGYGTASWVLLDLVRRSVDAGATFEDAIGAVARGAFEGWYGHGRDGVERPGLDARMHAMLGADWEPLDAVMLALLSIGADDRIVDPVLKVPFLFEAWRYIQPGGVFRLGAGHAVDLAVVGIGFAHYRLHDDDGLGGTLRASTPTTAMEWAVVRVR